MSFRESSVPDGRDRQQTGPRLRERHQVGACRVRAVRRERAADDAAVHLADDAGVPVGRVEERTAGQSDLLGPLGVDLRVEPEVVEHIQSIALRAYKQLGCRDYARVDMRLDPKTGDPFILEVNPNPDLADGCAFAQCVRASGRTYEQAIQEIVSFALQRSRNRQKAEPLPSETLLREYLAQRRRQTR